MDLCEDSCSMVELLVLISTQNSKKACRSSKKLDFCHVNWFLITSNGRSRTCQPLLDPKTGDVAEEIIEVSEALQILRFNISSTMPDKVASDLVEQGGHALLTFVKTW